MTQPQEKICWNCKGKLEPVGSSGVIKVDSKCNRCNLYYLDGEPVAYQVKNIITPIDLST